MATGFTEHRDTTAITRSAAGPFLAQGASPLVATLLEEMGEAWRRGERPRVEDFLAQNPELSQHPEGVVQLINEEICLRQDAGEKVDRDSLLERFAQYRPQLEILLQCHELLEPSKPPTRMPEVGEMLGDVYLAAELGTGAQGRVFVATQPGLADRPVVLKVSLCEGNEHLSLARLQHTHIVPLYWVRDDEERNLRVLCMPYYGGTNLDALMMALSSVPFALRTGKHLLDALDRFRRSDIVDVEPCGPARQFLARCTYVEAICWIGACLADALQYAHERNLLHLDLKPSNVLLTADAQPMLLDFHLAHPPIRSDGPMPEWFGGTRGYMSPEQELVLTMVREQQLVPRDVDHRSDIFGLGLVLYRALGGLVPEVAKEALSPLELFNPRVSPGLADVVAKCLHPDPDGRYASAAELAGDLRRHLAHQPLRGVPNRSRRERWAKWRRRRPHAVAWGLLVLLVVATFGFAGAVHWRHLNENLDEAQAALVAGEEQLQRRHYEEAAQTFARALSLTEGHPTAKALTRSLQQALDAARQSEAAEVLHGLAEQVRFLADEPALSTQSLNQLERSCRTLWEGRETIRDASHNLGSELQQQVQADLLDLAVLGADLRVRLATDQEAARREALRVLSEAESVFGPSPVLYQERRRHSETLGYKTQAELAAQQAANLEPRTAWEYFALGRGLLKAGQAKEARALLDEAVRRAPDNFWANFYQGQGAYRAGRYAEAAAAFRACLALEPQRAECYYNRALAYSALKDDQNALRDFNRALELNPELAPAYFNRGVIRLRTKDYEHARADFQAALARGADPELVRHNLGILPKQQAGR